jgi:hypothetical protein
LHPGTEIRAERFNQQMEMIAHDDIARKLPPVADHGSLESLDHPLSVRIIADDSLPGISPRHHVIDSALEFDPKSSGHVASLNRLELNVKPQTKNKG